MKKTNCSMWRSGLCLIMALCLIIGMCPVTATAAEDTLNYVSLGDSMTNGYGLNGYKADGDVNGYLQVVPEAYPAQFSQWLENYTGKSVELTQLAISRMRSQDVCYLLTYGSENEFPADAYIRNWLYGFAEREDMDNIYPGARGIENVARKYQESVKNADIISVSLGNNDFGTFLTNRFCYEISQIGFDLGGVSSYDETNLEELLVTVDESVAAMATEMYDVLMEMMVEELENQGVNEFATNFARSMTDVAVYTYVGFILAYKGVMEYIVANNPDAEIMIITLPNHMRGMQIALPGENGENVILDMDAFYGYLIDSANVYVSALPTMLDIQNTTDNVVYYVTPNDIDLLVDEIARGNFAEYSGLRESMVEDIPDFVLGIVDPSGEQFAKDITLAQVEALENALAGEDLMASIGSLFISCTQEQLATCAAYLGLEKAAVRAANEGTIDAGTFAALLDTDVMDQIFADVLVKYDQLIAEAVEADPAIQSLRELGLDTTQLEPLVQLKATPDALAEALDDPTINALLHLVTRFLVGEGIGCHASNAGYDTVTEAMAAAYTAGYTADEAFSSSMDNLIALLEKYGPAVEGAMSAATTAKYVLREDSYYVALGDGSAAASSYVEKLATHLGIPHKNMAVELNTAGDQLALISSDQDAVAHIEKADLVTVGFSNVTFIYRAIDNVLGGRSEVNWTKYVSEEDAVKIKQGIAELVLEVTGTSNVIINNALEAFAFAYVDYACTLPELVNAVRKINPEAVVLIVGMYNPLDGVIFEMNGTSLDIGEYVDQLVDVTAVHAMAYCAATGNAVYVDAPEVATVNEKTVLGLSDMFKMIGGKCDILNPSDAGHSYIRDQILNALIITEPGSVDRVYGTTRIQTALGIAKELKNVLGVEKFQSVILATGSNFADALSGSYLASVEKAPILLVDASSLAEVKTYVSENLAPGGTIYILGGTAAVAEPIEKAMKEVGTTVRLSGKGRYDTNLEILKTAGVSGKDLLVCTGAKYADALSASSAGLPILLVDKQLSDAQKTYLETADINEIIILGGSGAVSDELAATLAGYDADEAVERISGKTRYETSVKVASRFFGSTSSSAVLAYAENFPDGLCGGALAAALNMPVVLTSEGKAELADDYIVDASYGVVLGGTILISDETVADVFELDAAEDVFHKKLQK